MILRFGTITLAVLALLLSGCSWVDDGVDGNIPPRAVDDLYSVPEGGTLEIATYQEGVLGNDEDGSRELVARLVEGSGPLEASRFEFHPDGRILYVHNGNEPPPVREIEQNGEITGRHCDVFEYIANDGIDDGEPREVCIDIVPVNDKPVINKQKTVPAVNDGDPVAITLADLEITDPDNSEGFRIEIAPSDYYRLEDNTIWPSENYSGPLTVSLTVNDGADSSEPFPFQVDVLPDNDAPVITQRKIPLMMLEDTSLPILRDEHLLIEDVDNVPEDFTLKVEEGEHYKVEGSNQTIVKPDSGYNGPLDVRITLTDDEGQTTAFTLKVEVQAVDDGPPVAANDTATTTEDAAVNIVVLGNDSDPDGAADIQVGSVTIVNPPANGTSQVREDGSVDYEPKSDYNGTDSFTYTVKDAAGGTSNTATVTITVTPQDDGAPKANDDPGNTTAEDKPVTINVLTNDTDPDGSADIRPDSVTIATNPANGTAVANPDGTVTYTPAANYHGTDSFTYTVRDAAGGVSNSATVTIEVTPGNDLPVAANDTATTAEGVPVSIAVLDNDTDPDGDGDIRPDGVTIATNPANGAAVANPDGTVTYTPAANYHGTDSFTYTVKDTAGGTSNSATVTVTVTPVNDPPVAVDDSASTAEDAAVTIAVLTNDTDPDGNGDIQPGSVTVADPANGAVVASPDGTVTYTPAANYHGTDSFTYTVRDAAGETSNPATVTVTISAVDDGPPVAGDDVATTDEDVAVTIPVLDNDTDPDGDGDIRPDSVTIATNPANGAAVANPDGTVTYTPAADYNGTDSFTYTVKDSSGGISKPATVTVTITAVNDPPTMVSPGEQPFTIPEYSFGEGIPTTSPTGTEIGTVSATDVDSAVSGYTLVSAVDNNNSPVGGAFSLDNNGVISVGTDVDILDFEAGRHPFTLTITATDGSADSEPLQVEVTLTDVGGAAASINQPPQAADICKATPLDVPVLDASASATDPDGDDSRLRYYLERNGSKGEVTMDIGGRFSYVPRAGARGVDSFTYRVVDGQGAEALATVKLIIGNTRIMPLGDVITAGSGAEEHGYRALLRSLLVADGYAIEFVGSLSQAPDRHEGHSGAEITTGYLAARVTDWLAANPADVVLLHVGSQDFALSGDALVSGTQLDNILGAITAAAPGATILLAKIIDQNPANPEISRFNRLIDGKGREDSIIIVDQFGSLDYPADLEGVLLPTAAGYSKMATAWRDALTGVLDKCP